MSDRVKIIYGHLAMTDYSFGFVSLASDKKTWSLDETAWKTHCSGIAKAGANAVRILPYAVWEPRPYGRTSQFCPWALDKATNRWDLMKWNPYYFPIMTRIIKIANDCGLEVLFPWFDHCQQQPGTWTKYTPWRNNINGVTSFYDTKADKLCYYWIRMVLRKFEGLNVLYPWGNELAENKKALDWVRRVIFPAIKAFKIPYDRMTYGFTMDQAEYLGKGKFADKSTYQDQARKFFGEYFPPEQNKLKLIREVHKCGTLALDSFCPYGHRPAQAAFWWGDKPAVGKWILSDDGVHECNNPKDGGRPDAARWKAMATWAKGLKNPPILEHLPEGGDLAYQINVIKAMRAASK